MLTLLIVKVLPILLVSNSVQAYPNGAPVEACRTFRPGHQFRGGHAFDASTIADPNTMFSLTAVQIGDLFEVSLKNILGNRPFKGFLMRAIPGEYSPKKWRNQPMLMGRWRSGEDGKLLDCLRLPSSAITHIDNDEKKEAAFVWVPPKYRPNWPNATVTFVATVVEKYERYWSGVTSKLHPIRQVQNPNVQTNKI